MCQEIIKHLNKDIELLQIQKNNAYKERNRILSTLTKFLISDRAIDNSQPKGWQNIIIIKTIYGQMVWHVHESEMYLFEHLPFDQNYKWDGHTTEEKYKRLEKI